jgi:DNA-directed RNA polymerase specialized sigma subunit
MRITKKGLRRLISESATTINRCAWKYSRNVGAEKDDLRQEGYLALLQMVEDAERPGLGRKVSTSLRGMIRDAAFRPRLREGTAQLSGAVLLSTTTRY